MCHEKPELIRMNGNCGDIAPGPLPLLVGNAVDRCPVVLGHGDDAPAVAPLAGALFRDEHQADPPETPFMRSLRRTVAEWRKELSDRASANAMGDAP